MSSHPFGPSAPVHGASKGGNPASAKPVGSLDQDGALWRQVQTTLQHVSPEYKVVPFNVRDRLAAVLSTTSVSTASALVRQEYGSVRTAFDAVVDECHTDIHAAMRSYAEVLRTYAHTTSAVADTKKKLTDCKRLIATGSSENIMQLRFRSAQMQAVVDILDQVHVVLDTPAAVERFLSHGDFLQAAQTLMVGVSRSRSDEFNQFEGLGPLRRQLLELQESLFQRILKEMDAHTYGPALERYRRGAGRAVVSSGEGAMPAEIGAVDEAGDASMAAEVTASLPDDWRTSAGMLVKVAEGLGAMGPDSLADGGRELMASLRLQLNAVVDVERQEAMRRSTVAAEGAARVFAGFTQRLCSSFLSILHTHTFLADKLEEFSRGHSSAPGGKAKVQEIYNSSSVWGTMQIVLMEALTSYLQHSDNRDENSLRRRHVGKKRNQVSESRVQFSLANAALVQQSGGPQSDTDDVDNNSNVTSNNRTHMHSQPQSQLDKGNQGSDPRSALVPVSPYNALSIHNIVVQFVGNAMALQGLSPDDAATEPDAVLLSTFLDGYISEMLLPRMRHDLRTRLSDALKAPEAFSARSGSVYSHTASDIQHSNGGGESDSPDERNLLESAVAIDALLSELRIVMDSLPEYIPELQTISEGLLLVYLDAMWASMSSAIEGTTTHDALSRADIMSILSTDPDFRSVVERTSHLVTEEERTAFYHLERLRVDPVLMATSLTEKTTARRDTALTDRRRLLFLCSAHQSLEWLSARITRHGLPTELATSPEDGTLHGATASGNGSNGVFSFLVRDGGAATDSMNAAIVASEHASRASRNEVAAQLCSAVADLSKRFSLLSRKALFAVRLLVRWQCAQTVELGVDRSLFLRSSVPLEPDSFVQDLGKQLGRADQLVSTCLPRAKARCIFAHLPRLLAQMLIEKVKESGAATSYGVKSMLRNTSALKQKLGILSALGGGVHAAAGAGTTSLALVPLDRAIQYLSLMELSASDLFEHVAVHRDGRWAREEYLTLIEVALGPRATEADRQAARTKLDDVLQNRK